MEVWILPYGATLTHLFVPDKHGVKRDVVLGGLGVCPSHASVQLHLIQHSWDQGCGGRGVA
jgi:hypothetical protein